MLCIDNLIYPSLSKTKNKTMKELSFFLLKNSFGSKMRKGFKNFCNGDSSTSTLNQHHPIDPSSSSCLANQSIADSPNYLNNNNSNNNDSNTRQPTLEEMILQLDLEEKMMARRAKLDEYYEPQQQRMSCVNSSDILRSARNALNQYPRFSLDGKDAMYRSSFKNMARPVNGSRRKGFYKDGNLVLDEVDKSGSRRLPTKVAGESVVWCKPGVVGKLMGLDAMPVNIGRNNGNGNGSGSGSGGKDQRLMIKRQNLRKRAEREVERGQNRNINKITTMADGVSSNCCSKKGGYCVINTPPVAVLELRHDEAGWPMRRFL